MKKFWIVLGVLMALSLPLHAERVLAELEYFYAPDGTLTGKAFNGRRVNFEYDLRGQLLAVTDAQGNDLERYTYDPAGNRLSKTVGGVTTTYTYDEANQLISSTVNGVTTHYKYDAAGRLVQAGDKSYLYNGRNKVVEVRRNGGTVARFEYNIDGQISKAIYGTKVEEFIWDGLALVWRSGITYVNEPYITGGNPVLAGDDVLFNDMLGSTLAINGDPVEMTSFGETGNPDAFFTGKPMVDELGYAFLFRDYNPAQGKWTTSDPLGYPDGWNNFGYVGNRAEDCIDLTGGWLHIVAGAIIGATFGGISNYITSGGDWDATLSGACIGGMGGALVAIGVPAPVIGLASGLVSSLTNQYAENKDMLSPESVAQDLTNSLMGLGLGFIANSISQNFMIDDAFWVTETQMNVNNGFFTFISDGLLGITASLYMDASESSIDAVSSFFQSWSTESVYWQMQLE